MILNDQFCGLIGTEFWAIKSCLKRLAEMSWCPWCQVLLKHCRDPEGKAAGRKPDWLWALAVSNQTAPVESTWLSQSFPALRRQYQNHNPRPGPVYAGGGYTPINEALLSLFLSTSWKNRWVYAKQEPKMAISNWKTMINRIKNR